MIVLDSSFLIAIHNLGDVHHSAANAEMESVLKGEYGQPVLLEYVFLEVVTVILLRRNQKTALAVADILLDAREMAFLPCSEYFLEVFETFRRQRQAKLSFVDCAILTAARREKPGWVATLDHDLQLARGIQVPEGLQR